MFCFFCFLMRRLYMDMSVCVFKQLLLYYSFFTATSTTSFKVHLLSLLIGLEASTTTISPSCSRVGWKKKERKKRNSRDFLALVPSVPTRATLWEAINERNEKKEKLGKVQLTFVARVVFVMSVEVFCLLHTLPVLWVWKRARYPNYNRLIHLCANDL